MEPCTPCLPRIIAFLGMSGAGKDTAADAMQHELERGGREVVRLSFADAIKDVTAVLLGCDRALLEGRTAASRAWREAPVSLAMQKGLGRRGWTPLQALKDVGKAMRDGVSPQVWAHVVAARIHDAIQRGAVVLLTDARFPEELTMLEEQALASGATCSVLLCHVQRGPPPAWWQVAVQDPDRLAPLQYAATRACEEAHTLMRWPAEPPHASDVAWWQPLHARPHACLVNDGSKATLQRRVAALAQRRGLSCDCGTGMLRQRRLRGWSSSTLRVAGGVLLLAVAAVGCRWSWSRFAGRVQHP